MDKKRQIIIGILVIALLGLLPTGCGKPGSSGPATDRVNADTQAAAAQPKDRFENVRAMIGQALTKWSIPSLAVAVAKDGRIVWEQAWGFADQEKKIPASPDTMYSLASISKSITATGLMVLVEKGLIDLNRPANDYLGPAPLTGYAADASLATVKMLLQHTAGLPAHANIFFQNHLSLRPAMEESIRRYGILTSLPGERYNYSNFGFGILDHIISRTSKKSFPEFMDTEVFKPLGMNRTTVLTGPLTASMAVRYSQEGRPLSFYDFDHRGASAICASAHDLVRFGMFQLKNHLQDQEPILSDRTIELMHTDVVAYRPKIKYGLGFAVIEKGGYRFISHTGGMPGVTCRLTFIPSENAVSVILSNSGLYMSYDYWDIELAIFAALIPGFPAQIEPDEQMKAVVPNKESIGDWAGICRIGDRRVPVALAIKDAHSARLTIDGAAFDQLKVETPLGPTGFYEDGYFRATFFTHIDTPEANRSPHVLFLEVKLREKKLQGTLSACAINQTFMLPYWIDLAKISGDH